MKKQNKIAVVEQTISNTPETAEVIDLTTQNGNEQADSSGIPDLTGIKFATPKTVKGKSTRPVCEHTHTEKDKTGANQFVTVRCQLRVLDGEAFCVNHVPAERRITEDEGQVLSAWLETMTAAERLILYVRTVGWFKAKEQAKAI